MKPEAASIPQLDYKRIRTLFDGADEKEQESEKLRSEADADRWEGARLAAEHNAAGDTQQFIADQIGRDQQFVSHCITIWKDYGKEYASGGVTTLSFGELLVVYKNTKVKDRKTIVEEAKATGKSAASLANKRRRRREEESLPREGKLPVPKSEWTGSPSVKGAILDLVVESGETGITDAEITTVLATRYESTLGDRGIRHLREALNVEGWIVPGETRTEFKRPATAWRISEDGALQYGLDHGFKAVQERRPTKGSSQKSTRNPETEEERRRRLEREAIKAAEQEFLDGNRGAARFRSSLKELQSLILTVEQLHKLLEDEKYACPPKTQEGLLHCLEFFIETATDTVEDLRRHQPPPVDLSYYQILGVPPEATATTIKKAYRELARLYHPDSQNGNGDPDKFREIAHAYAILSDPEKRRHYNAEGVRR